jgi:hypothetical protein
MVEEFQNGREITMAIEAMRESIVALRDKLSDIKWVMGGFATASLAAFAYFYLTTTDLRIAVAQIDEHVKSVDARLENVDKRFDALEARMDKRFEAVDARFNALEIRMDQRFEAMDKRFDALTTLILTMQPPQKRTEGLGSRQ